MISAVCVVALSCLISVSLSAPLTCEELVRPLDQLDPGHLGGIWAMVAGSVSHLPYLERFKQRDSAFVNVSRITSGSSLSYVRSLREGDTCQYHSFNISLDGSSFTFDHTDKSNISASFVHTSCHDCLLMRMDVESGIKRIHFYLFSRRRELEQQEMEEFKTQVECLNMPPPVLMDPTKELCPEEAAQAEETTQGHKD